MAKHIPSSKHGRQSAREAFMTNLSLYLVESADMYPDGPALRCDGVTTTFSELADNATRFASYLAYRGLRPGDGVGVMLANRPEFAMVFYGVLHAGAVVVPMDPLRSAREVEYFLTNTGARLLVFAPSCRAAAIAGALAAGVPPLGVGEHTLEQLTSGFLGQAWPVTRAGNDNAVIVHTSGTRGALKGAQLTHSNLVSNQAVIARRLLDLGPDDVVLVCLPLFHAFGMTSGLGAAISTGTPIEGVQMRVVDEHATEVPTRTPGEIQVRGHNVMKGYWDFAEDTAAAVVDGWFSTGDIGLVDEDGYFFIIAHKDIST